MRKLKYSISRNALNQMYMSNCYQLLNMRHLYGMAALNKTRKHFKKFKMRQPELLLGLLGLYH